MLHLAPARRNRLILVAALATMVLFVLWVARSALVPYIFALGAGLYPAARGQPAGDRVQTRIPRAQRSLCAACCHSVDLCAGRRRAGALLLPGRAGDRAAVRGVVGSREQLVGQGRVLAANIVIWYERAVPPVGAGAAARTGAAGRRHGGERFAGGHPAHLELRDQHIRLCPGVDRHPLLAVLHPV